MLGKANGHANHNLAADAARQMIGGCLLEPSQIAEAMEVVRPDAIFDKLERATWQVITGLHQQGDPVDVATVKQRLDERREFIGNPTAAYLAELLRDCVTAAHVPYHANLVKEAYLKRRIYDAATEIAEESLNGKSGTDLITAWGDIHEDLRRNQTSGDFPRFSLAELHETFRVLSDPVIHGMIREAETANFISDPKVGKSWAMYSLAISVATGTDWLGLYPVSRGRVLIVDNELHPETLAYRIPAVGNALGLRFNEYRNSIDTWCLRGNLRSLQELLVAFKQLVKTAQYRLIVFDAKYRFAAMGVSENDNAAETLIYNTLDQIAAETRAAVVVVHHASKGGQGDKRVTDVGAGAGAQSRAADCHIVLREHADEGAYVLSAAVRSFPPVSPVVLRWQFPIWVRDDTADTGRLKGRQEAKQRSVERDQQGIDSIVDALRGGPATARELRAKTKISKDRLQRLLEKLLGDGVVHATKEVKRGNDCTVFWISPSDVGDGQPPT